MQTLLSDIPALLTEAGGEIEYRSVYKAVPGELRRLLPQAITQLEFDGVLHQRVGRLPGGKRPVHTLRAGRKPE